MENAKRIEWVLRIAVAGEFLGHGVFALQGKQTWINWIVQLMGVEIGTATTVLTLIGLLDVLVAIIVLLRPIRIVVLWAVVWDFGRSFVRLSASQFGTSLSDGQTGALLSPCSC